MKWTEYLVAGDGGGQLPGGGCRGDGEAPADRVQRLHRQPGHHRHLRRPHRHELLCHLQRHAALALWRGTKPSISLFCENR